jgi:hypothetical protein
MSIASLLLAFVPALVARPEKSERELELEKALKAAHVALWVSQKETERATYERDVVERGLSYVRHERDYYRQLALGPGLRQAAINPMPPQWQQAQQLAAQQLAAVDDALESFCNCTPTRHDGLTGRLVPGA